MIEYINEHLWAGVFGVIAALATYIATHFFGKPLLKFIEHRENALQVATRHIAVGWNTSHARQQLALAELRPAVSQSDFYWHSPPLIVRLYCLLRGYNREYAYKTINGIMSMMNDATPSHMRTNNLDALRWSLGADTNMTAARKEEIRKMIVEEEASKR